MLTVPKRSCDLPTRKENERVEVLKESNLYLIQYVIKILQNISDKCYFTYMEVNRISLNQFLIITYFFEYLGDGQRGRS